ncbi:uncharacterized protein LOC130789490 [Actinidia eriantha]|uniref:uncharacterized protein LOC130789490 n=1 Tax=Actinidia eriantha TaxID=165200 RepID=UPI002585DE73|nr:uncharacterized protein LOC130789490 [Actinidia eriantha]
MATSSDRQQENVGDNIQQDTDVEIEEEFWRYIPLVKAVLEGNWDVARRFFDQDESALTAQITPSLETALHIAVGTGKALHFVKELVESMPVQALEVRDHKDDTALHIAAWVGNTAAAVLLVEKHQPLLYMRGSRYRLPVHLAAVNGRKDTLSYLLRVTMDDPVAKPYYDLSGIWLLMYIITSGFYDIALNLIDRYPHLATLKIESGDCALGNIASKVSAFPSGNRLNLWERIIYSYVPVKLEKYSENQNRIDIENHINISQEIAQKYNSAPYFGANFSISGHRVSQKLQAIVWKFFELAVPRIKHIQEQKQTHHQALQLVKCLCEAIRSLNDSIAYESLAKDPLFKAVKFGVQEVVEEIVDSFPNLVWAIDSENCSLFHRAVIERHENVFNLIYRMSEHRKVITIFIDKSNNTTLHWAGRLAPENKLNLVPGAALQMQRELQWFKEVEKFVIPYYMDWRNDDQETPAMVFTKEHKKLVVEGEKWMKDTANSCTIAAALIATIAFAAAITVPGGNNTNGLPMFSKEKAFIIFAISDAISLFTSTTSLLMFLSILTSRYAEGDFLYALPKRLIIGLVALFLSITTMMVAFSSTLYLVFGHDKQWIVIPTAVLAGLPITSFVSLQFPLLVDLISSTYGPGIFGKQSDRPFY